MWGEIFRIFTDAFADKSVERKGRIKRPFRVGLRNTLVLLVPVVAFFFATFCFGMRDPFFWWLLGATVAGTAVLMFSLAYLGAWIGTEKAAVVFCFAIIGILLVVLVVVYRIYGYF